MCSGPSNPSSSPPSCSVAMDGDQDALLLLELSACDDLEAFKRAVEIEGLRTNGAASWYGPSLGAPRRMCLELRTPLMIAAAYGSLSVLDYILSSKSVDVNQRGSDGASALHCAAAGGSAAAVEISKLLIEASADVDALDASGNRPADLIPRQVSSSTIKSLEVLLKASDCSRAPSPPLTMKEKEPNSPTKKEYPPDLTLPDIKNGICSTDEFRMYAFKIKPCSRAYSHDWTECPFVHPGENARRRDPRKYSYSCVPCPEFRKGSCRYGDACEYAHGVFECWLHPAQYRTRLCKDETNCNRRVCFFAHKPEELRTVIPSSVCTALGGSISSPRSPRSPRSPSINGAGMSPIDMALLMMQPGSPSAGSSSGAWMSQPSSGMAPPPPVQLPSSRLKSTLRARDMDLSLELLTHEGYQQKLYEMNAVAAATSPRSGWVNSPLSAAAAAASRTSDFCHSSVVSRGVDYGDILGPLDTSKLQGLSLKHKSSTSAQLFSSPTGMQKQQSLNQQILSGYGTSMSPSSPLSPSSSLGIDQPFTKVIMNSRASPFSKRSQSFVDPGLVNHQPGLSVSPPQLNHPSSLSNWGSSNGRPDWGIEGDELSKLGKSMSFNSLTNPTMAVWQLDEPDLSWVQSLVKDAADIEQVRRISPDHLQAAQVVACMKDAESDGCLNP